MLIYVVYECARTPKCECTNVCLCVGLYRFCELTHIHGIVLAYECICVCMYVVSVNAFLFCMRVRALEMCGNDFFDPILSHSYPIPIVVYENIPIPSRNKILIPIPFHSHSRTWYLKFRTSYDYLE